jgi:hypothetical protein
MSMGRILRVGSFIGFWLATAPVFVSSQQAPSPKGARTLLLPRRIVSGEQATLAVLDANGRLTPGVTVRFSNGDQLKTDATGRGLIVAPLTPGVIFGSIAGRPSRVSTAVLTQEEAASSSVEISAVPQVALVTDRFEISGRGFCGDADSNQITVGGLPALVLASSPVSVVVLPPGELKTGTATVTVSCAKKVAPPFRITFVELALEADSSPLKPGEHRSLTVQVHGTSAKIALEARNLAPDIAELAGGTSVKQTSSGGPNNTAKFTLVGRKRGRFSISIRLVPIVGKPSPKS